MDKLLTGCQIALPEDLTEIAKMMETAGVSALLLDSRDAGNAAAGGGALLLALAFLLRLAPDRPTAPPSGALASNAPTSNAPQVASSATPAESSAHSAFSIPHSAFPRDPAVLALRAAFALPADTPPAVGIAVRPASDLLTSSVPPPDDFRL